MDEITKEISEKNPQINFPDWTPFQDPEFIKQLTSLGITYIPPNKNKELREQICKKHQEGRLDQNRLQHLLIILKFFEKGLMIDNFGKDEEGRHKFLFENKIAINGREINLYDISKQVNKLAGNPISSIIILAGLYADEIEKKEPGFANKVNDLIQKINMIKDERGFFIPDDLAKIEDLAKRVFNYLIS